MFKPIDAFAFASTLMIMAAVETTARAGHDDSPAESDHTWFAVTADDDGSCRGTLSSPLGVVTGMVQVAPGARRAWATFRSGHGIGVAIVDPLGFAIDVGTSEAKVSTSDSPDGLAFRLLERKAVPTGTSAVDLTDVMVSSYWIGAESGSTSCIAGSGQ